jgi:anti-anti-sigma regulatory factor
LDYRSRIKVHNPCRSGVLVELHGEFDVSCLEALRHAFERASGLASPVFADLSGVAFMDALCARELASRATEAGRLKLCRPSAQFSLSLLTCGLAREVEICPDQDPGYEAVISEVCARNSPWRRNGHQREHRLYVRQNPQRTPDTPPNPRATGALGT